MYDAFLGLNHRPFAAVVDLERYFPAAAIENARKTLARALDRGEGVGLVMGPAGTGKTLLLASLAAQFQEKYAVAMLSSGRVSTRRALFQAILHDLRRPYRGMDEGELRLALCDHLLDADQCPYGLLLLVDEAHTLSLRVLDEIRMLTNVARRGAPLVRLVLSGSLTLEERLTNPKLESFNQRVVARCYLEALTRSETVDYIQSRIHAAGGDGAAIFPAEACQSVFKATDGVPRLVNQVCDHAIVLACVRAQKTVDTTLIDESWADLQQLPTPWNETPAPAGESEGVIEFGALNEDESFEQRACDARRADDARRAIDTRRADGAHHADAPHAAEEPAAVFEFGELDAPQTAAQTFSYMDAPAASPEEQVEQIEQMICEAEQPGIHPSDVVRFSDGQGHAPEVDLFFDDADHPFQEAFEEEELVSDRYLGRKGPPGGGVFDRMVASSAASVAPMALPPKPAAGQPSIAAQDATAHEAAAQSETDQPVVMPMKQPAAFDEDDGVLMVESDYDDSPAEPTTYRLAPVRRQEYGQLFARLRRKSV